MPAVVASGRKPEVRACGSCHRSEGTGGPENSSLAGLSVDYFVQQMADFKSGARKFSGPQRSAVLLMTAVAEATTDAEVQAAAEYFSALKPKRNIKVVESDTAPKTYIARLFFVKRAEGGTGPPAGASSKCRTMWSNSSFVTHDRNSPPTCRSEASRGEKLGQNRRIG